MKNESHFRQKPSLDNIITRIYDYILTVVDVAINVKISRIYTEMLECWKIMLLMWYKVFIIWKQ